MDLKAEEGCSAKLLFYISHSPALVAAQTIYNKCSGLVDMSSLKNAIDEGKSAEEKLKTADVEGLLATACRHRESPDALEMFKIQLAEVTPIMEKSIPKVLLEEARQAISKSLAVEQPDGKKKK